MSNSPSKGGLILAAIIVGFIAQAIFLGLSALAWATALPLVTSYVGIETSYGFGYNYGVGLAISLVIWFSAVLARGISIKTK